MTLVWRSAFAFAVLAGGLAPLAATAQDFGPSWAQGAPGAYDGYDDDDAPVPPRRVPGYRGPRSYGTETVVTTTRRIIAAPADEIDVAPRAVVTTRRVAAPPVGDEFVATGGLGRPLPPPPVRRVLKSEPPALAVALPVPPARVITTRRIEPVEPAARTVIIEERRVETTRRILRPAPLDLEE